MADNDRDPLATNIADDVIQAALQSVERSKQAAPAPAAAPPGAEPAAVTSPPAASSEPHELAKLQFELGKVRQTLREREAELEASQAMGRQTLEKLRDQHERMLRAAADLENFKKRAQREREETARFGQEKLLRELLPVMDNLDRALDLDPASATVESIKLGVRMTRKLFEDTLGKHGVTSFSGLNQPFDPSLHEAMQAVESDVAPGTVVHEMVRGFKLHDRLMRPAMVVVSKARAAAQPVAAGAENAGAPAADGPATTDPNPSEPAGGSDPKL